MDKIQAWQQIYANVEKDQSPHKRGGFQTLFYTRSAFTEAEVEEMEARLPYFRSESKPVKVKRVFFTTATGKVAVAQIHSLTSTDSAGRQGRYLAHSLVFAPEAFARLGGDPFRVFRHFPFIATVEDALAQGDFQTGDIPPISLEFPEDRHLGVEAAGTWTKEALKMLTLLALRAEQLARDRSTIHFVGDPKHIENALEAALFAVPAPLRHRCPFDTYFYKCNLVATYYWAVGLPAPPGNPTLIVVDAQTRQIRTPQSVGSQPETAYEHWAITQIDADKLAFLAEHRDAAFALCEWLDGRELDLSPVNAAPSEVVESVFEVNAEQVRERLRQKLGELLPSVLVECVFEPIYRQTPPRQLLSALRRGFAPRQLLDVLYETYEAQGFRPPPREETQGLEDLLRQVEHSEIPRSGANHRDLRLMHLCWTNQRVALRHALQALNEDEYRTFAQIAFRARIVEALALLLPNRGEPFLELYLESRSAGDVDLVALVEALLAVEERACLTCLIPYIQRQPAKTLQTLEKIVSKHPDLPVEFRQGINDAVAALPPKRGVKDLLRAIFKRDS